MERHRVRTDRHEHHADARIDSPASREGVPPRPSWRGGRRELHGYTKSGKEYIVYYERGVGTGAFDQFRGGAFGAGLTDNIRHAYKFLSFWYEPGDEIFIYGFSRGAYAGRSLVGYLEAAGLLRGDACDEELESVAWEHVPGPRQMIECQAFGIASRTMCMIAM